MVMSGGTQLVHTKTPDLDLSLINDGMCFSEYGTARNPELSGKQTMGPSTLRSAPFIF